MDIRLDLLEETKRLFTQDTGTNVLGRMCRKCKLVRPGLSSFWGIRKQYHRIGKVYIKTLVRYTTVYCRVCRRQQEKRYRSSVRQKTTAEDRSVAYEEAKAKYDQKYGKGAFLKRKMDYFIRETSTLKLRRDRAKKRIAFIHKHKEDYYTRHLIFSTTLVGLLNRSKSWRELRSPEVKAQLIRELKTNKELKSQYVSYVLSGGYITRKYRFCFTINKEMYTNAPTREVNRRTLEYRILQEFEKQIYAFEIGEEYSSEQLRKILRFYGFVGVKPNGRMFRIGVGNGTISK